MKSTTFFTSLVLICALLLIFSVTQDKLLVSDYSRNLSKMHDYLWAYKGEEPVGSNHGTTLLLGIFSATGKKYDERRRYIRDTYLATEDDRICKLEEFKRQAKGKFYKRRCKIAYTFVVGAGSSDRPYDHDDSEALTLDTDQNGNVDEEDDCAYLNIREVRNSFIFYIL